jgi:rhodanese-related sulfurtransferase
MKSISVTELNSRKDEFVLLDVREPHEVTFAKVDPHVHIPMGAIPIRYEELDKKTPIVVMCHSGVRSAQVCQFLEPRGFDVTNLEGGIDAWSQLVDPKVPRY